MILVQAGNRGDHSRDLFKRVVYVCDGCGCIFLASDKDFAVCQEDNTVYTHCPDCGLRIAFIRK